MHQPALVPDTPSKPSIPHLNAPAGPATIRVAVDKTATAPGKRGAHLPDQGTQQGDAGACIAALKDIHRPRKGFLMNMNAISAASVSVGHGPGAGGNEGTAQDRGTAAPDSNLTSTDAVQERPQADEAKTSANISPAQPQPKATPSVHHHGSGYVPSASATGEEDPGANPDVAPVPPDPAPLPDLPTSPKPPPLEIDPPPPMEDPLPGHELPVMPQPISVR
jgi:hypothetical protein